MEDWPVYALLGSALLVATGMIIFVAGAVKKLSRLMWASFGVVLVSSAAVAALLDLAYWKKPECYLANGQLDESREECRMK